MSQAYLLASIAIALWSTSAYLSRLIAIESQFVLVNLIFLFAAITLGVYVWILRNRRKLEVKANFHKQYLFWGVFGYFLYSLPLIQSLRAFDSASEATILNYTWPVFTVLFSSVLFRKISSHRSQATKWLETLAIGLGFLAVVLVATEGQLGKVEIANPAGVLWGLLSGLSYGIFSAYSARLSENEQPVFLLTAILISLILTTPMGLWEYQQLGGLSRGGVLIAFILGVFMSGFAYIAWTGALRLAKAQNKIPQIAALIFMLPPLSLSIVAIFLKESNLTRPYFALSVVLVILSSVLAQRAEGISKRVQKAFPRQV
ncbi:MAG: DMT family transporter [Chloroflexi bacterium]|nr:MAG: DMT family transporter [Chloroflexota bacterium]MBL1196308.1 DMT family transporter [Chloroflexota bacterium]NOH13603.1 DMT family transporter [Chloroflexota bacterium]